MKENILIVSYDQVLSRQIADKLAEFFSMRVFSAIELFEFDNIPRTLDEMIAIRGIDYVKDELAGIIKFSTDYQNVVFVSDLSMHETCRQFMSKIIASYIVVILKDDIEKEVSYLENKQFGEYEKELYLYNRQELEIAENSISELADVVVGVHGRPANEIVGEIVSAIKTIYNVN